MSGTMRVTVTLVVTTLFSLALAFIFAAVTTGCFHPTPPGPVPPDADAAPWVPSDAGPPATPCQAACDVLAHVCGPQLADCATTYAHIESARQRREPDGAALTCQAVASANSAAEVRALGLPCGP
jgi:hypothetical protein